MAQVHISDTVSGYLPVLWTGEGADMDREAYSMAFGDVATAERAGRAWAEEQAADFVPYREIDTSGNKREMALIKQLREEENLPLRAAITKARAMLAEAV